jgi:hypothetical protein
VHHCSLCKNFPVVLPSHSYNQVHSATKYSFPYYPTCRVKQGICIILQNAYLQQNRCMKPRYKLCIRNYNKWESSSVDLTFLQKIGYDLRQILVNVPRNTLLSPTISFWSRTVLSGVSLFYSSSTCWKLLNPVIFVLLFYVYLPYKLYFL